MEIKPVVSLNVCVLTCVFASSRWRSALRRISRRACVCVGKQVFAKLTFEHFAFRMDRTCCVCVFFLSPSNLLVQIVLFSNTINPSDTLYASESIIIDIMRDKHKQFSVNNSHTCSASIRKRFRSDATKVLRSVGLQSVSKVKLRLNFVTMPMQTKQYTLPSEWYAVKSQSSPKPVSGHRVVVLFANRLAHVSMHIHAS